MKREKFGCLTNRLPQLPPLSLASPHPSPSFQYSVHLSKPLCWTINFARPPKKDQNLPLLSSPLPFPISSHLPPHPTFSGSPPVKKICYHPSNITRKKYIRKKITKLTPMIHPNKNNFFPSAKKIKFLSFFP